MPLDNGTYEIYNVSVDKYFDLKDASVKPDNNVIGYHRDETRAQKVKKVHTLRTSMHLYLACSGLLCAS